MYETTGKKSGNVIFYTWRCSVVTPCKLDVVNHVHRLGKKSIPSDVKVYSVFWWESEVSVNYSIVVVFSSLVWWLQGKRELQGLFLRFHICMLIRPLQKLKFLISLDIMWSVFIPNQDTVHSYSIKWRGNPEDIKRLCLQTGTEYRVVSRFIRTAQLTTLSFSW